MFTVSIFRMGHPSALCMQTIGSRERLVNSNSPKYHLKTSSLTALSINIPTMIVPTQTTIFEFGFETAAGISHCKHYRLFRKRCSNWIALA